MSTPEDDYPLKQLKLHFPNCDLLGLQSCNDVIVL